MPSYTNSMSVHASPLRYPGGKAGFADFLQSMVECNDLSACDYYEPFAGGAGAALALLRRKAVAKIHLNDADYRIFAFWNVVLRHNKEFVRRIERVELSIDEWYRQHEVCEDALNRNQMEVALATFFMNRCNRSGVLSGAGPIGGYGQTGPWRLDVRFNRQELAARLTAVGELRSKITVSNLDALDFLDTADSKNKRFVYLDPPYVQKGQRLYLNAYAAEDHHRLAMRIQEEKSLAWVVSYDNTQLVKALYSEHNILPLPVRYTLQRKRSGRELLIIPKRLRLPAKTRLKGKTWFPAKRRTTG